MKAKPKKAQPPRLARRILEGLEDALAHAKGSRTRAVVHVPQSIDVKAIREAQRLTQEEFAARYGFALSALREWEQGRRQPDRAARVLLKIIAREPKAVRRALAAE